MLVTINLPTEEIFFKNNVNLYLNNIVLQHIRSQTFFIRGVTSCSIALIAPIWLDLLCPTPAPHFFSSPIYII